MALSKSTLQNLIHSNLMSLISSFEDEADSHLLTGKTQSDFYLLFAQALSNAIIDHITSNAEAVGLDSRGDSHTLSII